MFPKLIYYHKNRPSKYLAEQTKLYRHAKTKDTFTPLENENGFPWGDAIPNQIAIQSAVVPSPKMIKIIRMYYFTQ